MSERVISGNIAFQPDRDTRDGGIYIVRDPVTSHGIQLVTRDLTPDDLRAIASHLEANRGSEAPRKHANIPGYPNMPLSIWGKATMLLNLLSREGLLPDCHIYGSDEEGGEYQINGIRVGHTEEQVTTCIWLMVESYAAEGHIDFQANQTIAEAALEEAEA